VCVGVCVVCVCVCVCARARVCVCGCVLCVCVYTLFAFVTQHNSCTLDTADLDHFCTDNFVCLLTTP